MSSNKRNCYIVSRRFNPGHLSHLLANFKMLSETGFSARFCWNYRFSVFTNGEFDENTASHFEIVCAKKCDLVLVWFPSIAALLDMILVRVFTNATVVYVFHEPFSSLKSYIKSGFGLIKTAKIALVSLVNYAMVCCAHKVILPSNSALATYAAKYSTAKHYARFPLMFDDEAAAILPMERREYIAYIGTVAEDHAFDEFLKFAIAMLNKGMLAKYKFLVATRSVLAQETIDQLLPFINAGAVVIQCGRPLSNDEINGYYSRSIVVWNAYKRSMQSGVLPKAYMFGTPVIISGLNRSEYFLNNITGIEISPSFDVNEMQAAVNSIVSGFHEYSTSCRAFFIENFFYKSFANDYLKFVTSVNH